MSERTNGLVSPAQMDTTEYPPEGQNVECDTWLGSHPHQASSRLHPGLDLTTVTTTTVLSVERNYEPRP